MCGEASSDASDSDDFAMQALRRTWSGRTHWPNSHQHEEVADEVSSEEEKEEEHVAVDAPQHGKVAVDQNHATHGATIELESTVEFTPRTLLVQRRSLSVAQCGELLKVQSVRFNPAATQGQEEQATISPRALPHDCKMSL
jgi:hypothetical protein